MKEDIFELNSQNNLLNHIYKQDNIRIIDGMACNKKCIIICSSNGIYFPNTYEEFRLRIICNNFFEGGRTSSLLIEHVERIILIRDVRKSFYVTGINEKYNSVDKVLLMLKKLTKGYEIITAGSSAGGYMATIVGSRLNAQFVINVGGQWNLYKYNSVLERYNFLMKKINNSACNKWFDLRTQLQDNEVPVFYLYSALNESDMIQIKYAQNINNIYPIAIKSSVHAQSVSTEPYIRLLCGAKEDVFKIYNANKGCMVDVDILENQINTLIALPKGVTLNWATTNEKKQKAYMDLLYEWVKIKQNMCTEMRRSNCTIAAIWGKGKYCKLLLNELEKQNVEVKCIVETQPLDEQFEGIPIVNITNLYKDIDIIIVIPYYDIESIKERVYEYYKNIKVIGVDEYIKQMYLKES